ncbi:hypothetical protein DP180_13295 [Enterobacter kobei]|uniref:Uncharacterized protein n=1 Tax=Enterobacter kobei TaxID=208224 RepID=A0ABX9EVX7_9ENTR|nr:hypothetical protein C3379_05995 [Enterobacter cloacae complex sp. ECNIH10]POV83447.1 hypothetical protein C3382_08635 [Enterobacter cloacae complex sp. ECNIH9]PWR29636.1 hypothetical protein DK504_03790 [Enterobacter kobei]PYZ31199.1 hypothetical protein DNK77_02470 [Enterobacter cloacae complex sp.]RAY20625.1 hypothetical protein DP180_13295 [Enterobacter kobei]
MPYVFDAGLQPPAPVKEFRAGVYCKCLLPSALRGPKIAQNPAREEVHKHAVVKTAIQRLVETGQQSKLAALRHEKRLTYGELAIH